MDAGGADALLCFVYCNSTPATSVAPTWGGAAMTSIATHPNPDSGGQGWIGVGSKTPARGGL
jgi:hypothetical protein